MKVIMVEPNKLARVAEIGSGLRSMQKAVGGGQIEAIYPYEDLVSIVCCETGKIDGMPLNRALRGEDGEIYDILAGPFFIAGISQDNFASIPDDLTEEYLNLFLEPEIFVRVGGKIVAMKDRTNRDMRG
ncbi:hypothetical protein FACS1894184_03560 [Clostridia bacterium]|nr:hypothetical protein FACS1894184_03560 [Clostridia bacterium]